MLFVWIHVLPVWLVRACKRMCGERVCVANEYCGERECVVNEYVFRKSVYVWRNQYFTLTPVSGGNTCNLQVMPEISGIFLVYFS